MVPVLVRSRFVRFFPYLKGLALAGRGFGALLVGLGLAGAAALAEEPAASEFGKAIELAPFQVNGKPLAVSILARTKADRRYAEKFADEVVEVAYETLDGSVGQGLVIVGAKGEPHPYYVYRKFLELAKARKISPTMVKSAHELDGRLKQWKLDTRMDEHSRAGMDLDFDTMVKALPMPLEGAASTLYQLAWSEGFDDARIEQRLMALTRDDLARDELKRYDWVFYLPPSDVTAAALKEIINKGMAKEKMGLVKRAAIRSALVIFSPAVKKAVEGMRKGVLFMTVLRAQSSYSKEDIDALTRVYVQELMPDFKPGSGDEKRRALAAIEKQKIANAEYAKDPFVKPERLATYDPAAYAPFLGEYTAEPPKVTHWFKREGDGYQWKYKERRPRPFYPAGDRLLVSEDGRMTIRFQVDENGAVTGVEERWARRRQTIPRKT